MHVDLDYFFAQVEERENPSIKDKPVVVCVYSARGGDSGAVSTTNYIARRLGVKSGIPIVFAKRILKDKAAVFLPVNHPLYGRVSEEIMNLLRSHSDNFEQGGIDEAFLEVTKRTEGDYEKAQSLAQEIKTEILEKERLTCSIGIGLNKLVAKIASDYLKPDGLTVVKPEQLTEFLSPLPVGKLLGVGRKTEERMNGLGIEYIGQLAVFDPRTLTDHFGRTLGIYFHNAANGIDESLVQERAEAESLSRITTLKENTRELNKILEEVYKLSEDIVRRMKERNLNFKSVTVIAIMENLRIHSRTKTMGTSIDDSEIVKTLVKELFENFLKEEPKLELRRVGIKVSNFAQEKSQKPLDVFLSKDQKN
jgi:DNA polymerase IV (archaeal DinB-like DNA polymerase)